MGPSRTLGFSPALPGPGAPIETMPKILLVDDDAELTAMLAEYLVADGFTVIRSGNGFEGADLAVGGDCDLVVLDVMMPDRGGIETLRVIRASSHVPVLMLTARGDEVDKIVGLELGADDYVPKPCTPRELAARIRAILRRTTRHAPPWPESGREAGGGGGGGGPRDREVRLESDRDGNRAREAPAGIIGPGAADGRESNAWESNAPETHDRVATDGVADEVTAAAEAAANPPLVAGDLLVWPRSRRVEWRGRPLELTSTQFSVLEVLARHAGTVVSKPDLSRLALARPLGRFDRSLDVHISILRQKLDGPRGGDALIKTIRGIGYQLAID